MILPEEVPEVAERVARLNALDLDTALAAVWAAGDCMELDAEGRVLVRLRDGRELALVWPE